MSSPSLPNLTCPLAELRSNFTPYQNPENFSNTHSIVSAHDFYRFGHTNNVSELIGGSGAEQKDYVIGLLSASIVIFAVFAVWLLTLFMLKCCCGYKMVGFFSGKEVRLPKKPLTPVSEPGIVENECAVDEANPMPSCEEDYGNVSSLVGTKSDRQAEYEKELERYNKLLEKRKRRIFLIRAIVILCGLLIIAASALMITMGVKGLSGSLDEGRNGLGQAINLTDQAMAIVGNFQTRQAIIINQTRSVQMRANGICPNVRDQVCQNVTLLEGCNFTGVPAAPELQTLFEESKGIVVLQLDSVQNDLLQFQNQLNSLRGKLSTFDWAFWVAAGFAILLSLLTLTIMYGVIVAWNRERKGMDGMTVASCLRGWLIGPIFVFLVIICWIFSMVFVIGSLVTSDVCHNSPDIFTMNILQKIQSSFTAPSPVTVSIIQYAVWIVMGCQAVSQPAILMSLLNAVQGSLKAAYNLAETLASSPEAISQACGSNATIISTAATALGGELCVFGLLIFDLVQFFSCNNWHPLYGTVMYQATCYQGNTGFAWISSCQIVIVFCSMTILTLRAAFYQLRTEDGAEDIKESNENADNLEANDLSLKQEEDQPAEAAVLY